MTCYIISIEVSLPDTRKKIIDKLKSYGTFCPINHTCWAISTDSKAAEIRDNLKELTGPSDKIFVLRSGTEAAWRNAISQKHTDWLKKYL